MASTPSTPRIALLACAVFEREIAKYAAEVGANIAELSLLEIALHDRPDKLREMLQREVDRLDAVPGIEAVVLAYGLCGRGADGLCARQHPLVIARAHDCMTHFLGSKERYAEVQAANPEAYFYTPGWNRARRVPGPDRLEYLRKDLAERFDPEDVDYLVGVEKDLWTARSCALYTELGTEDAEQEKAYAQACATWLGWKFQHLSGQANLFRSLLSGPWDSERFQVVPPGQTLSFSCGPEIFRAKPSAAFQNQKGAAP